MNCIFCAIIEGKIPSSVVYEDEKIMAIRDINPQAAVHVVVFPKQHAITCADDITADNAAVVADIFAKAPLIAAKLGLVNGYRIINNCGADACQTIKHLHFHILGGQPLPERMG